MNSTGTPLVSVICLCYNHSSYVIEAINSVLAQSYPNVELIIVDDASNDESRVVIGKHIADMAGINFIALDKNVGNCNAFNLGWRASSGQFVIDLAADDVLLPERISVGVSCLLKAGNEFGVHFTDARLIDKSGKTIGQHLTAKYFEGNVPNGIIFQELLKKYFINPVTMMYSKVMLDYLEGYDENLAYEDFDLWIRSSKKFRYCFSDEILVAKRILKSSHSGSQYKLGSKILASTLKVCEKAYILCGNEEDFLALDVRLNYEMKMAFYSLNWPVAIKMFKLRKRVRWHLVR